MTDALLTPRPAGATGLVYVANAGNNSVTAYATTTAGNVAPAITLAAPNTLMGDPVAIAHDGQGRLFVACQTEAAGILGGKILVFAPGAYGNATPIRSFQLSYSKTDYGLGIAPTSLAVDSSGYTYAAYTSPFRVQNGQFGVARRRRPAGD